MKRLGYFRFHGSPFSVSVSQVSQDRLLAGKNKKTEHVFVWYQKMVWCYGVFQEERCADMPGIQGIDGGIQSSFDLIK